MSSPPPRLIINNTQLDIQFSGGLRGQLPTRQHNFGETFGLCNGLLVESHA